MNPLRGLMQGTIESYDANFNVSLNRGLMSFNEPVREFSPLQLKPALWLDASDQSTLTMDGAASFTSAGGQNLSVASNSTLTTETDIWISGWFYPTSFTDYKIIALKGTNIDTAANSEYNIITNITTGLLRFVVSNGTTSKEANAGNATMNSWNFFIAYLDLTNKVIKISKNGGSFSSTDITGFTPVTGGASFNLGWASGISAGYSFKGSMDSFCVGKPTAGWLASNATALRDYLYNSGAGRRSSDFINSALYSASGAVSSWDLDERSGTRKDRIGTNDLTDNNSVGYASGIASGNVQYDGDPIKQWSDKSGNARHVTATSDSARPTWKTAVQNGKSIIRFDGVNDVLTVASMINSKENVVMFLVNKYTSGLPAVNNYNSSTGGLFLCPFSNGLAYLEGRPLQSGAYSPYRGANKALTLTAFNILAGVYTTSDMTVYVNGASGTPLSFSSTNCGGFSKFSVGLAGADVSNFGAGDFCEVIIFDKALSTSQRQQVERYLANKWGIPVN